ncbi:hypothetical protein EOL70_12590 [Leucothrix sargassi]|nr:hypothetical protein EOL70_12590 [Leucothrix sargassi]
MIKNNKLAQLTLTTVIAASLAACGGSSDGDTDNGDGAGQQLAGVEITTNNAAEVFQTGVADTVKLSTELLYFGDDFDFENMSVASFTENSVTYNCDQEGLVTVTDLSAAQTSFDSYYAIYLNNCVHYGVHYHGDTEFGTVMGAGTEDDIGSLSTNWSATRYASYTNLARTSSTSSGTTNLINGDVEYNSSYNTSTNIYYDDLSSTNLSFDVTAPDASESSYDFSGISVTSSENTATDNTQIGMNFIAEHSEFGDMALSTDPVLGLESSVLQSGEAIFTTGTSSLLLEAVGNDNIDIYLIFDNDIDVFIGSTTWSGLFGNF